MFKILCITIPTYIIKNATLLRILNKEYKWYFQQVSEKMAAHIPTQGRPRNDPQALERQAIADDEEAALLANQQAQVKISLIQSCSFGVLEEIYYQKILVINLMSKTN